MSFSFSLFDLFWIFLILVSLQPIIRQRIVNNARLRAIRQVEKKRGSRVIVLIQRQETMSFLGFPLTRYIDVNDSERVLRAIKLTDPGIPIDLVLHTPAD
jgi:ClpP class serine protease